MTLDRRDEPVSVIATRRSVGPSRKRVWLARGIAVAVDVIQLCLIPLLAPGYVVDDVLDVICAIVMVALLGWHWAFLPALGAEMLPFVDLVPTWTAAVWIVTRRK